jgi:hypothetical protein
MPREEVMYSNALASVTRNCVIVTDADGHGQTILALPRLSSIRKVTVSYPILLVLAAAALIIAAAAGYSKDGGGAGIPIALVSLLLLLGYAGSRKAAVLFLVSFEAVETALGTPKEADEVIAAIEKVQRLNSGAAAGNSRP